jgi:hypothetical protein
MTRYGTTTDLDKKIKKQSITMSTIIGKVIEAIVIYITIYFFKPVWEKIVGLWKKRSNGSKDKIS